MLYLVANAIFYYFYERVLQLYIFYDFNIAINFELLRCISFWFNNNRKKTLLDLSYDM